MGEYSYIPNLSDQELEDSLTSSSEDSVVTLPLDQDPDTFFGNLRKHTAPFSGIILHSNVFLTIYFQILILERLGKHFPIGEGRFDLPENNINNMI